MLWAASGNVDGPSSQPSDELFALLTADTPCTPTPSRGMVNARQHPGRRLESLQILRGIAALVVVLMHFGNYLGGAAPSLAGWLKHGALGVDVFFVISGFIIYLSTARTDARDPVGFVARRLCRVVLPAWAAMALYAATRPPYLHDLLFGLAFIPLRNIDPPFYGYGFLIVAWTLTYELVFYALFAAVLCVPFGRRHRGWVASAVIVAMVLLAQAALGPLSFDAHGAPLAKPWLDVPVQLVSLVGNPIFLEFIAGIFLAWCWQSGLFDHSRASTIKWSVIGLPLLGLVLLLQYVPGHGVTRGGLFAFLAVAYSLVLQSVMDSSASKTTATRLLLPACIALGECSYSLYLTHPAIKSLLVRIPEIGPDQPWAPVAFPLAVVASVLLAVMFYRWVELPAQSIGRALAQRRDRRGTQRIKSNVSGMSVHQDVPWH